MKRWPKFTVIILLAFTSLSCLSDRSNFYYEAMEDIKSKNIDFAFIKLNSYLRENPDSPNAPQIKFAIIEYYFQTNNYSAAIDELTKYINGYPAENNTVFAQTLLYKILSENKEDSPLLEKLKEAFFSKSIFLTFSDSKIKSYTSIFGNKYKVVDYVDRIEVFKNKELLFEIKP